MEIKKANVKKPIHLYVALVLAVVALAYAVYFYLSLPMPPGSEAGTSPKDATALDAKGRELVAAKKYDQAIGNYGQALTIRPGDYSILMDRAQAYYNKKDYQAALNDYQFALSNNAKIEGKADPAACTNNAMFGVALCQAALERPQMAVKTLHELQAKDGHYVKSFQVLGDIYLKSGDSEAAIDAYTSGLRLNPESSALHYDRSLAYSRREMRQQAFDDLSRAIDLDKTSLPMYLQHANLAYKMHKDELADSDAKEILRLEPENRSAILWLKKRNMEADIPPQSLKASADIKPGETFPAGGESQESAGGDNSTTGEGKKAGRKGHRISRSGASRTAERAQFKANEQGEAFTANAPGDSKDKVARSAAVPASGSGTGSAPGLSTAPAQSSQTKIAPSHGHGDPGLPSRAEATPAEPKALETRASEPRTAEQKSVEQKAERKTNEPPTAGTSTADQKLGANNEKGEAIAKAKPLELAPEKTGHKPAEKPSANSLDQKPAGK